MIRCVSEEEVLQVCPPTPSLLTKPAGLKPDRVVLAVKRNLYRDFQQSGFASSKIYCVLGQFGTLEQLLKMQNEEPFKVPQWFPGSIMRTTD